MSGAIFEVICLVLTILQNLSKLYIEDNTIIILNIDFEIEHYIKPDGKNNIVILRIKFKL